MRKLLVVGVFSINIFLGVIIGVLFYTKGGANGSFISAQGTTLSKEDMTGLSLQNNFNKIAKISSPAVVSIEVEIVEKNPYQEYAEEYRRFFSPFFDFDDSAMPKERVISGFGSGFIISEDGYIVTNNHVVDGAKKIKVTLSNDEKYKATVVGRDPKTDIALIKIKNNQHFPFLALGDSNNVSIGDIVVAIGNPFNLPQTFTSGVVSSVTRSIQAVDLVKNYIQTDVAINPGNSGGPLLNLKGEVIGINTLIFSPNNAGNIGIGFAIPISTAKIIVERLKKDGKIDRGFLGISISDINDSIARALNIKAEGVYISSVSPGSPASKAGLKEGDVILSFNGENVKDGHDFVYKVQTAPINQAIDMEILRDGKKQTVTIKLESQSSATAAAVEKTPQGDSDVESKNFGIAVSDITPALQKHYRINVQRGAVITAISPDSPLYNQGIVPGNVIVRINNTAIESASDFEKAIGQNKEKTTLFYITDGSLLRLVAIETP